MTKAAEGIEKKNSSTGPVLTLRDAGQIVRQVPLREELRIGRAADNDLVLGGIAAARYHARIYRQDEHYFVVNVGSGHSTWVNGIALIGQRRLRAGDRILIADSELVFEPQGRSDIPSAVRALGDKAEASKIPLGPTERGPQAERAARRRLSVALTPAGIVLVVALALVALYWLVPGIFRAATPTPEPTVTLPATSPAPTVAPAQALPTVPSLQLPPPESLDETLVRAGGLVARSRFEEAIQLYQDVTREAPDDPRPEIGWAWALILGGFPDQALLHARRAAELAPDQAEVATVLARACVEMGDAQAALSWAQEAATLNEGSAEANAVLALAHTLAGQEQEAIQAAELALEQDTSSAQAHRSRGWVYHEVEGDTQAAIRQLRVAAGLEPDLWIRHHELGLLQLEVGAYEEAIVSLTNALVLHRKADTYTALGRAHFRLGQDEQAKSFLEQSLSAGAWDADTYGLLALINARQGRCEDARVYLDQALAQDPSHARALEAQAACAGAAAIPPAEAPISPEPLPSPTPLTGRIAFPVWNHESGQYDVYLAALDGSARQLVAEQVHQPAFDPAGQWLAVNGERPMQMNLLILRPDGSGLREVTHHVEDSVPSWSPGGESLVFGSTRHADRRSRLYVIDKVPFEGPPAQARLLQSNLYELMGDRPAWVSDGRIVYNGCDPTAEPPLCGLFLIAADPGLQEPTPLTAHVSDTAPAVHGDRVIFMSNRDGNWELYAIGVDGSGLERLTYNTANDGLPAWSPDGHTVAFVSDQGGVWAIWAIDPDGSNRRKLFNLGGGGLAYDWDRESISWAPE
jgi:tetratricopeptide (TPR) repeat protein/pSer/pThr/pTyr-binding forkhead associated (FHA) protein